MAGQILPPPPLASSNVRGGAIALLRTTSPFGALVGNTPPPLPASGVGVHKVGGYYPPRAPPVALVPPSRLSLQHMPSNADASSSSVSVPAFLAILCAELASAAVTSPTGASSISNTG
ncbi:Os01g0516650 [Oryza sativa Japonica Group]|uniref:Os01g0516650 protein n=1 Tax=Oryza sativa subsp. japonica TaxID=39947 RepID=A0A0P0V3M5_ORYSJ|nr:Os01g0516650 [Oryza sativa Japonica Group]